MSGTHTISSVFNQAETIPFDHKSKFVFMSDVHRSDGSSADNFQKNLNIYYVALLHYYRNGFTYIELGDGDEMWENKKFSHITKTYPGIFKFLSKMYHENRFYMLYGNHDAVKKKKKWLEKHMSNYLEEHCTQAFPLFPDMKIHEGLLLKHRQNSNHIFLIHGHQADFFNYNMWRLSRFLVRYVWKPLELVGIKDPFSTSYNPNKKDRTEQCLSEWALKNQNMLIAGHTHRPVLPKPGESLYVNDGCCVHMYAITAIEIENDEISLVQWSVQAMENGILFVDRKVIEGPYAIEDFFVPIDDTSFDNSDCSCPDRHAV